MERLRKRLKSHQIIALDTSILIYHFEARTKYLPLTHIILENIETGNNKAVISTISLMEIAVGPLRFKRHDIVQQYEAHLANFPNLYIADITRDVARKAAYIRAEDKLAPPDSLLIANAIINGATLWLTNDKRHDTLKAEIDVLILDEFL